MLIVNFYYITTFVTPARHIYFLCMTHFGAVLQKITNSCNQKGTAQKRCLRRSLIIKTAAIKRNSAMLSHSAESVLLFCFSRADESPDNRRAAKTA